MSLPINGNSRNVKVGIKGENSIFDMAIIMIASRTSPSGSGGGFSSTTFFTQANKNQLEAITTTEGPDNVQPP